MRKVCISVNHETMLCLSDIHILHERKKERLCKVNPIRYHLYDAFQLTTVKLLNTLIIVVISRL